jgi:hypothetical protein
MTWETSREMGFGADISSAKEFNAARDRLIGTHNLSNDQ